MNLDFSQNTPTDFLVHFVRSKTIPRIFWMAVTQIIMVLIFLLYASALNGTLFAAAGLQQDFLASAMESSSLGNPAGAILFSALLAGQVYDTEAAKQMGSSCIGPSCFRLTFLILSGLCGVGTLLAVILTVRIRPEVRFVFLQVPAIVYNTLLAE